MAWYGPVEDVGTNPDRAQPSRTSFCIAFPTIPHNHLNVLRVQCVAKSILFEIIDRELDQFGDVIDPHHLALRSNEVVENGSQVS